MTVCYFADSVPSGAPQIDVFLWAPIQAYLYIPPQPVKIAISTEVGGQGTNAFPKGNEISTATGMPVLTS